MSDHIDVMPPANSDSSRYVRLRLLAGGRVAVVLRETTMLGRQEQIGVAVRLDELLEAVKALGGDDAR